MRTAYLLLLQISLILALCGGTFLLGRITNELNCDTWCDARQEFFEFDAYLACKTVCHELEIGHVHCMFEKIDNAKADKFLREHGSTIKRKRPTKQQPHEESL